MSLRMICWEKSWSVWRIFLPTSSLLWWVTTLLFALIQSFQWIHQLSSCVRCLQSQNICSVTFANDHILPKRHNHSCCHISIRFLCHPSGFRWVLRGSARRIPLRRAHCTCPWPASPPFASTTSPFDVFGPMSLPSLLMSLGRWACRQNVECVAPLSTHMNREKYWAKIFRQMYHSHAYHHIVEPLAKGWITKIQTS